MSVKEDHNLSVRRLNTVLINSLIQQPQNVAHATNSSRGNCETVSVLIGVPYYEDA